MCETPPTNIKLYHIDAHPPYHHTLNSSPSHPPPCLTYPKQANREPLSCLSLPAPTPPRLTRRLAALCVGRPKECQSTFPRAASTLLRLHGRCLERQKILSSLRVIPCHAQRDGYGLQHLLTHTQRQPPPHHDVVARRFRFRLPLAGLHDGLQVLQPGSLLSLPPDHFPLLLLEECVSLAVSRAVGARALRLAQRHTFALNLVSTWRLRDFIHGREGRQLLISIDCTGRPVHPSRCIRGPLRIIHSPPYSFMDLSNLLLSNLLLLCLSNLLLQLLHLVLQCVYRLHGHGVLRIQIRMVASAVCESTVNACSCLCASDRALSLSDDTSLTCFRSSVSCDISLSCSAS
mmetsp:Transcript_36709/g.91965  ORF Transcript_36709/g.91965 Transcript_36709/m.91965 type:complete len:346 (+) Transcript_36709:1095-2132(+)